MENADRIKLRYPAAGSVGGARLRSDALFKRREKCEELSSLS
jgi:hypothetical protein